MKQTIQINSFPQIQISYTPIQTSKHIVPTQNSNRKSKCG